MDSISRSNPLTRTRALGLENPARHYFDCAEDPRDFTKRTLSALERLDVNIIAINRNPQFSGPMPPDLYGALEARFPDPDEIGKFEVRKE